MTGKIVIPMITPHNNGSLDLKALDALLAYALENGFDGVFAASSTGGCASLSYEAHRQLLEEVIGRSGNLDLFANISRNNLDETLAMLADATSLGYSRFVIINPYYHKFSEGSMFRYFSAVAERTGGSLFLYNNPSLTGTTITPALLSKLAGEHSGIRGIKDSGGDLEKFREFLGISGLEVYQGKDHLLEESLLMGAYGGVCSTSNFSLNTLHVAHDAGSVSHYTDRIRKVTEIMKKNEVPAFHNYMFRKYVMGQESPRNYMNAPFGDLQPPPSDEELRGIV